MTRPVIAVDGGGTRARLSYDGRCTVETGPANVGSDFGRAVAGLRDGLARLAGCAGLDAAALAATPAYLGLAGCLSAELAGRVAAALPLDCARVEDDRPAAVRGALGDLDGAVAHCGTGSFLALQAGGRIRLAGGWGAVLGDEASAAWVGRRALSVTLDACDGIAAQSGLTRMLAERHGGPAGIVAFATAARPDELGRIAPLVTERAGAGDAAAAAILRQGAGYLARLLAALGHVPGRALCLTGGIGPHYAAVLPPDLAAGIRAPAGTPLDGALALARDMAAPAGAAGDCHPRGRT
ncbi:BadF/BadG/BcrA/BcrD ATPase family protein [Mangrovicoccus algicola]|uniref:ATPase n=1 Tax=Mangrovicoccus algicola TaxID=2771008 RepID=A0A8J6ZBD2_9RHOB|nr:BadF/BadG/BcrA/BcrD ATPase family protein [Mangrovicoccus algicola]MBE3639635.1 ATPase [Mangrovicoccus algicola]